jgi:UDP-GlcNAc:undecaprenyl-phosphate GlcNAc-1-phosphate transferase
VWTFVPVLVLPWLIALAVTPLVIRLAGSWGFLDQPSERKQHAAPTPYLGGLAVLGAALLGLLIALPLLPVEARGEVGLLAVYASGLIAMAGLGLWDDEVDLRPGVKLGGQLLIAGASWAAGIRIGAVEGPFGLAIVDAMLPSLLLTVLWIVAITNAFNWIDGMDGLATGIGLITMLTIFVLATDARVGAPILATLALSGALAGFLRFNLPRARIFLGDSGALAIGYAAAVLSIGTYQKQPAAMVAVVPLLAIGIPVVEFCIAIVRRFFDHAKGEGLRGMRPLEVWRVVSRADRGHIHFLMLRAGYPVNRTLFTLYAASGALALLALSTREASAGLRWSAWIASLAAGFTAVRWLERRAKRREAAAAPRGQQAGLPRTAAR